MVCRIRRVVLAVLVVAPLLVWWSAAPAAAEGPTAVSVEGPGLAGPLTLRVAEQPDRFAAVVRELGWLASRAPTGRAPEESENLGPRFVVTMTVDEQATQRYELYPLADGGPRVFRPAPQPDRRKAAAGWFLARLSLPDTLQAIGVPLDGHVPDTVYSGIGGGGITDDEEQDEGLALDIGAVVSLWQRVVLLNGAVLAVIAIGLLGFARLGRRRV